MKTINSILGVMVLSLVATLSSCSATLDAHYGRPVYARSNGPVRVIDDPDLPPVPYLSPRQVGKIKAIRRDERMKVDYLEQRKRDILFELDRQGHYRRPRGYDDFRRNRLQNELQKVGFRINQVHRRADNRVYSVLTNEQRGYWRR